MRLWRLSDPNFQNVIVLRSYDSEVYSAQSSLDGRWLVSVHGDKSIRVWDLHEQDPGKQSLILPGHDNQPGQVGITPNFRWVVSVAKGEVRVWPLGSLQAATALPVLSSYIDYDADLDYDTENLWGASRSGSWIASVERDYTVFPFGNLISMAKWLDIRSYR
jgi:WD40 repeat protein